MSSRKITCNIFIIAYITTWYGVQRIDQLMDVDTLVQLGVRLQFRCDKHNTKFQHDENLSLLSSHRNMKATFPKVLSPKRGQISSLGQKYNKPKRRLFVITTKLRTLKLKFSVTHWLNKILIQAEY